MKPNEQIIAEASRIEYSSDTGKLYIVFEVKDPNYKKYIRDNWINDIEFRIIDKLLVKQDE